MITKKITIRFFFSSLEIEIPYVQFFLQNHQLIQKLKMEKDIFFGNKIKNAVESSNTYLHIFMVFWQWHQKEYTTIFLLTI